jgi:integrase
MPRRRYSRPEPKRSADKPYRWLGEWHSYRLIDGKEKRVHRGPVVLGPCAKMSKAEAQAELDRRIAADNSQPEAVLAPGEETVAWMFAKYRELKRRTWADASREIFDWVEANVIGPEMGTRTLRSIKRDDCQSLLNALADAGRSQSLISKVRVNLKAVFDEALELDLIPKNPARKLDIPRTLATKCERYLTLEECERILTAAPTERDRLIIRICLVCGLRPGELFGLRRDDIEPGRIRIDETVRNGTAKPGGKTEGSKGTVTMPPSLEVEVRAYLRTVAPEPDALLFPDSWGGEMRQGNYLRRVLHPIGEAAGVKGLNFQSMRRTTATYVGKVGSVKDAQAMLRHSKPNLTADVYMQAIPESVRRTAEELDGMFGGKVQ